jgi:glycosyltransferase involved in cell wall biosynthesis
VSGTAPAPGPARAPLPRSRRLLVLAPVPTSAAATRFRLEQFFPVLRAAGVDPVLRPFLDEPGFDVLYRPGRHGTKAVAAARAVVGRVSDLVRAVRSDGVLVHREAALVGPPVIEWAVARVLGRPLLFDVDDAVWVPYASPTYGQALSRLLKAPGKAHFTLSAARLVICGNAHLAEYARRFNRNVTVVPTVVDTAVFRPAPAPNPIPVLGWIGTHSSVQYLRAVVPALRRLAARRRFVLRVVGADLDAPDVPTEIVPWSLEGEVSAFQGLDVGLYPLVEDAWALGKSGFKAVQYMACGVPPVASPVGAVADIVRDGENGFLAADEDAWVDRLERLLDDARLRRRLGDRARSDAVERWSLAAHAPRFVEVVRGALA